MRSGQIGSKTRIPDTTPRDHIWFDERGDIVLSVFRDVVETERRYICKELASIFINRRALIGIILLVD